MHKLIKFMVAVMLAFCLPLQGMAGVIMPACADHDAVVQTVAAAGDMPTHCMQAMEKHAQPSHDGGMDQTSHAKCHACYLSVAQAIASSVILHVPPGIAAGDSRMAENKYQTKLSPPFHPPKSTLALG